MKNITKTLLAATLLLAAFTPSAKEQRREMVFEKLMGYGIQQEICNK